MMTNSLGVCPCPGCTTGDLNCPCDGCAADRELDEDNVAAEYTRRHQN